MAYKNIFLCLIETQALTRRATIRTLNVHGRGDLLAIDVVARLTGYSQFRKSLNQSTCVSFLSWQGLSQVKSEDAAAGFQCQGLQAFDI